MALKRLYTGEMVSLSGPLTKGDHPDRQVLAGIPATAALLPELDSAHGSLLSTQVKPEAQTRLAAIILAEKSLDVRHDDLIRGVSGLLTSLAYLTPDAELAARVLHVLSVLLPDGLDAVTKSYREEAGQAALLESRLTPADVALLKRIKLLEGTAHDAVKEWMSVGAQLGALEDERAGLPETSGPAPADVVTARNRWIRTINAMRSVLDLVSADHPGVVKLLSRITEAERKADRRIASAEAAQVPSGPASVHITSDLGPDEVTGKFPGNG
jgi:DNA-binding TFAR19-related protein (PDSD5 family)